MLFQKEIVTDTFPFSRLDDGGPDFIESFTCSSLSVHGRMR